MLSRPHRISQAEFKRFIRKSRYFKNDIFFIRYASNHKNYSQYAIVISAKVSKLAVIRNRLRRVVSSWIEENIRQLPQGFYIAIYINKVFIDNQKEDIKVKLTQLLNHIR